MRKSICSITCALFCLFITGIFLVALTSCSIAVSPDDRKGQLSERDITKLSALQVPPEYVKEIQDLGYKSISVNDILKFWAIKVTPEYIREIKALGYKGISERDILKFWALKVTPEYIKRMKELGNGISDRDIAKSWSPKIAGSKVVIDGAAVSINGPDGVSIVINPKKHAELGHSFLSKIGSWATQLAIGICLIIAAGGCVAYFTGPKSIKRDKSDITGKIDERLSSFEKRTNDVQDVLISIDDRLNRKLL
jgi:hypothetical protein